MDLSINQRLREFITSKKISQEGFRISIGVAKKQQVSGWLTGVDKIPEKYLIETIRKYRDVNARWLLLGEGSMMEGESIEMEIQEPKPEYKNCIACQAKDAHIKSLNEYIDTLRQMLNLKSNDN